MTTQQIQFVAPGIAELRKIPLEASAPGMVTVRLAVSSISSGTERANLIGDPNISYVRSDQSLDAGLRTGTVQNRA